MSDIDPTITRRTVLKRASVAAAGALAATGSATALVTSEELDGIKAARDCDCSYEYKCEYESCWDGQYTYDYTEYRRECCTCDGDTVCEDTWSTSGCCPFRES